MFHSYINLSETSYDVYLNDIKKLCLLLGTECNIRCSYCTFVQNPQKITILKLAGGELTYYDWLPEFVDIILKEERLSKLLDYLNNLNNILGYTGIILSLALIIILILGLTDKIAGGNLTAIFTTFITSLFSSKKTEINSSKENNKKGE